MGDKVQQAVEILNQGGIIIYPTDTAFGIGCRMDDEKAVERLFSIRRRPESQPTPVLVDSIGMAEEYLTDIPKEVREKLIDKYWPGALTIILHSIEVKVPELVRGGTNTLGVRMPNHEIALAIIEGIGVPLVGPSANFHGESTPYMSEDIKSEIKKMVDFVVPGECPVKQPSTVIDCTVKPWKIIRQGAVVIYK